MFSFFSSRCFLKEIENMYSVFLSSYTNTRESLGELEKAVETLQGHPSTVFCKISVRISKYRLKVSTAPERLNISG